MLLADIGLPPGKSSRFDVGLAVRRFFAGKISVDRSLIKFDLLQTIVQGRQERWWAQAKFDRQA